MASNPDCGAAVPGAGCRTIGPMGRPPSSPLAPGATTAPGLRCTISSATRSALAWGVIGNPRGPSSMPTRAKPPKKGGHGDVGAKKLHGRQRQRRVETTGRLWRGLVHPAELREADRAPWLLATADAVVARVRHIWADRAYRGPRLRTWVEEECGWPLELGERPRRWVVERTIAWIGRYRRLRKEYESLPESRAPRIDLAMSRLMRRRLARQAPYGMPSPQRQGLRGLARAF